MSKSLSVGNQGWADRFNDAWNASNEKIAEACRILVEAKKALPKADFLDLIKNKIRCGESVARKLIIVGKNERLCALVHKLPVHWSTHYEFAKLTDDELDRALEVEDLSQIRRDDVKKFRAPKAAPTVTEAEYEDVTESPPDGGDPGDEPVSDGRADNHVPPVVRADDTPHDAREAGDSVVTHPAPPFPGMIPYWVNPGKPAAMISAGLTMALHASRALSPAVAARQLPPTFTLFPGDVTELLEWLYHFEKAYSLVTPSAAD